MLGFNDTSTLWVILCRLSEKGGKEIEEIVEEMKERDREERGTGMKGKKQKITPPTPLPYLLQGQPNPSVGQYQLDVPVT